MARYYEVDSKNKLVVITNINKISAEEKKSALNYKDFGYEVIIKDITPVKKTKEEREQEKLENPYSEINIRKYLEEKGTKEQQADYEKLFNEVMKDKKTNEVVRYKNKSKDGKHKVGDIRVIGHVNTLAWFEKTFPDYKTCDWVKKNFPKYEVK